MKISNVLALKAFAVPFEGWSLTGGAKCSDLSWKLPIFQKKMVADNPFVPYERWSQQEVRLWHNCL